MKTLCSVCGRPSDGPRCPAHRRNETERSTRRGTSGYARQKTSAQILERDLHMCQRCGGRATVVDHVIPLARGGPDIDRNKQSLCQGCHDRKTASERRAGHRG